MTLKTITSAFLAMAATTAVGVASITAPPTARPLLQDHGHKHEGDKGDEHKGRKADLGTQKIGGFDIQVTQVGDVKPGEEAIFIVTVKGTGDPKAVRAWVGVDSGQGSIKTKAEKEKEGEWHAHHEVSKPLPAKSKLWIEVDTGAAKAKASFDFKE